MNFFNIDEMFGPTWT